MYSKYYVVQFEKWTYTRYHRPITKLTQDIIQTQNLMYTTYYLVVFEKPTYTRYHGLITKLTQDIIDSKLNLHQILYVVEFKNICHIEPNGWAYTGIQAFDNP